MFCYEAARIVQIFVANGISLFVTHCLPAIHFFSQPLFFECAVGRATVPYSRSKSHGPSATKASIILPNLPAAGGWCVCTRPVRGPTYRLLEAPLTTGRGCAGRVDLPPQGPAELLSHPAAARAPRRSCGVRKGAVGGETLPAAAAGARFLLLLIAFQGRRGF